MSIKKKLIISFNVLIILLITLGIGLAYAYFSAPSTNSFGSKAVNATVTGPGFISVDGASTINDWDVTGVTNFTEMFESSKNGIHPE